MEEGTYEFYIGTDVRNAEYAGNFQTDKTAVTMRCRETAAPVESFQRMRADAGTGSADGEAELEPAWGIVHRKNRIRQQYVTQARPT